MTELFWGDLFIFEKYTFLLAHFLFYFCKYSPFCVSECSSVFGFNTFGLLRHLKLAYKVWCLWRLSALCWSKCTIALNSVASVIRLNEIIPCNIKSGQKIKFGGKKPLLFESTVFFLGKSCTMNCSSPEADSAVGEKYDCLYHTDDHFYIVCVRILFWTFL